MDITKEEVLEMMNNPPVENVEYHSEEQIEDYIYENIIELNTLDVSELTLDATKFKTGMDSVAELCGAITALVNVGITPSKAMEYLMEKEAAQEAMKHNIEMGNIQANAAIESAKYESVLTQRNSL